MGMQEYPSSLLYISRAGEQCLAPYVKFFNVSILVMTNKAILVVDVSGSTRLFHEVGDFAAHKTVHDILSEVAQRVVEHEGRVVKFLGDGLFALFPDPISAMLACRSIHNTLMPNAGLGLRMGLHFGDVLETDKDAFGDSVNVAFRVCEKSSSGEITAISDFVDTLSEDMREFVRLLGAVTLHGKPGAHNLYDLVSTLKLLP